MLQKIAPDYASLRKGIAYCINPGVFDGWFFIEFKLHSFCNYSCPHCCGVAHHDSDKYKEAIENLENTVNYVVEFLKLFRAAFPYRKVELTLIGGETMIGVEHFLKFMPKFKGYLTLFRIFSNGSADYDKYVEVIETCRQNFIEAQIVFSYHESQLLTSLQRQEFFSKVIGLTINASANTSTTVTIGPENIKTPLIVTQLTQGLNGYFRLDFKDLFLLDEDGQRTKPSVAGPHILSTSYAACKASLMGQPAQNIDKVSIDLKELMQHDLQCTAWYNGMIVYEDGSVSAGSYCPKFLSNIQEHPSKIIDFMRKNKWVKCSKEFRGKAVCPLCVGGTVQIDD